MLPPPARYDADGRLRVVVHPVTFTGVTDAAFNQIRQYGRGSAAVTIRLLEVIAGIAARASGEEDRAALLQQARMVKRGSEEAIPEERDRKDVEAWYRAVERVLEQRRVPGHRCPRHLPYSRWSVDGVDNLQTPSGKIADRCRDFPRPDDKKVHAVWGRREGDWLEMNTEAGRDEPRGHR